MWDALIAFAAGILKIFLPRLFGRDPAQQIQKEVQKANEIDSDIDRKHAGAAFDELHRDWRRE